MHLYLHDYNFVEQLTDSLTGSMSLTAATFASVLVASQLKTQLQVFAQVSVNHAMHLGCQPRPLQCLYLTAQACNFLLLAIQANEQSSTRSA